MRGSSQPGSRAKTASRGGQDRVVDDAARERRLVEQAGEDGRRRRRGRRCASAASRTEQMFGTAASLAAPSPRGVTARLSRPSRVDTPRAGVATLPPDVRRTAPTADAERRPRPRPTPTPRRAAKPRVDAVAPDLAALPIAGHHPPRMAIVAGRRCSPAWIVVDVRPPGQRGGGGHQPGRGDGRRERGHAAPRSPALERELQRIQQQRYILQQARGLRARRRRARSRSASTRTRRRCPPTPRLGAVRVGAADDGTPARTLADAALRARRLT